MLSDIIRERIIERITEERRNTITIACYDTRWVIGIGSCEINSKVEMKRKLVAC